MKRQALTSMPAWQALQTHQRELQGTHIRSLFAADPQRFEHFSENAAGLLLDYSKNCVTDVTMKYLVDLAKACDVPELIQHLFRGEIVNHSEARPALHMALRYQGCDPILVDGQDVMPAIRACLAKMSDWVHAIHDGSRQGANGNAFTDIVNIGIGGSDLGPKMVVEALGRYQTTALNLHFVSNIDGNLLEQTLQQLNPATTLFIVSSKSFNTQETLTNAMTAKRWFANDAAMAKHFIAVTANRDKAEQFGIATDNILPLWDWVGGRYSLWSAIGLPIALSIGMEHFTQLLQGAAAMDQHFLTAPLAENLPAILALLGIWQINFRGAHTHAVIPYHHYLKHFPAYITQLEMESNGKALTHLAEDVDYKTAPVIWGDVGTNGQHSFHQLLHQGTHLTPADFLLARQSHHGFTEHHQILAAHCFSQTKALMLGRDADSLLPELLAAGVDQTTAQRLAKHKASRGNQPSNTILFDKLTPTVLGALIALYEHKVFVQGSIWQINSFDQFGVEYGKEIADEILQELQTGNVSGDHDSSTAGLLKSFLSADKR